MDSEDDSTVASSVAVQPETVSVTVTLYVPAASPETALVVEPLDHSY